MRMIPSKYLRASAASIATALAVALAGIMAAAALIGCREPASAAAVSQAAAPPRMIVAVATAREQTLERTEEVQGALFPKERAVLAANVEGTIASISADFGDAVSQGQVLLKIDPREAQLRVDSAQAALDQEVAKVANSRSSYDRAAQLKHEQMMSAQQFDQISSQFHIDMADAESAEKTLAMARKKLADDSITAPFAGSVQKRMASLGEYVTPGKQLYELIAIDPIKLRCQMPERFVPMAKPGMPVNLTIDAHARRDLHRHYHPDRARPRRDQPHPAGRGRGTESRRRAEARLFRPRYDESRPGSRAVRAAESPSCAMPA